MIQLSVFKGSSVSRLGLQPDQAGHATSLASVALVGSLALNRTEEVLAQTGSAFLNLGAHASDRERPADTVMREAGVEVEASIPPDYASWNWYRPIREPVINAELRKLYPDAQVPEFEFEEPAPDELVIRYCSPRRLCALAEGLIVGAAAHYCTPIQLDHPECMHRGHAKCQLAVYWQEGAKRLHG